MDSELFGVHIGKSKICRRPYHLKKGVKREIYAEFFDFLADFLRGWAAFATFLLGVLKKARFETKGGERLFRFLLRVERVDHSGQQASFTFPHRSAVAALFLYATSARLLALASQGRHDVSQSDAEVVFLDVLKNREIQLALACELVHHSRRGIAGHPMPVDWRLRIAGA